MSPRMQSLSGTGTGGAGGNAFGIVQPDKGTSPTATTASDTLIVTSTDASIDVSGSSGTKTLDLKWVPHLTRTAISASFAMGLTNQLIAITASLGTSIGINLPPGASCDSRTYSISDESGNLSLYNCRLFAQSGEAILGSSFYTMSADFESLRLYWGGSGFFAL